MRRRLLIALIAVFLLFVIFVISGCSQLSDKESIVNKRFASMVPELTLRYQKVSSAVTLMEDLAGPRDVTTDAKKALASFTKERKKKNVSGELKAAQQLEIIIGRLRANATGSAKLNTSVELASALTEIDTALPATGVREAFEKSAEQYEDTRTSWRYSFSALFGGYSSSTQLEFSLPASEESS